ncbi:unnamed protein product [Paramecium octaurelia]|uniref:Uncharacterized protein n=1 Tax=Paramecium octaurelia TaxID=43137 RepID=A0A8S1W914_PAROT|nr:unnamed protein product [Paramecium octaurelia]
MDIGCYQLSQKFIFRLLHIYQSYKISRTLIFNYKLCRYFTFQIDYLDSPLLIVQLQRCFRENNRQYIHD